MEISTTSKCPISSTVLELGVAGRTLAMTECRGRLSPSRGVGSSVKSWGYSWK